MKDAYKNMTRQEIWADLGDEIMRFMTEFDRHAKETYGINDNFETPRKYDEQDISM